MWPLIIMCTIFCASAVNAETFRKCCPDGQSLMKVIDYNGENTEEYMCLDSVLKKTWNLNTPSSSIFVSKSVVVEYGMPKDCDLEMIQFDKNAIQLSVDGNYCYERLVLEVINGTAKQIIPKTVGLVCNGTNITSGSDVKIQNIRKCCKPGQMYDSDNHQCRNVDGENKNAYDYEWFIKKLEAFDAEVLEFENGLYCKSVEYDVQLKDEMFTFKLVGNALNIWSRKENRAVLSPVGNWCLDKDYNSKRIIARVCTQDCPSFGAYCIKKCCPIGKHYQPIHCGSTRSICVPNNDDVIYFNLTEYTNPLKEEQHVNTDILGFSTEITCALGRVVLNKTAAYDSHSLTKEGWLDSRQGTDAEYCLELFDWSACGLQPQVTAIVCYKAIATPEKNFKLSFTLICITCVCLLLTLVVYCTIPELRNLHGQNLICHVSTMLFAFGCLARVQYQYVADKNVCAALGYGIYFGFVAAFIWLNVMCVDIWWTFGSVRTVHTLNKGRATRRRFLWYSLYAWGLAVTITLIMFLLDKYPLTKYLDANMGTGRCWFGSTQNTAEDWPHYIFFVIPMGVVTSLNFMLWLRTARHCARVKSEVHRLQAGSVGDRAKKRFRIDKANLVLTGKLWVVMGAGWGTELLSTLLDRTANIWVITTIDTINELQGVFIFIILIFKPKLYYLIRKKLGLEKPDAQKNGQSSTARTSSTFLSRTISTDERANTRISVPNDNAKQC